MTAGVDVDGLIVGIFGFSGLCAALSGALLSYSLASASPSGLSDVIVPAAAAAILGGVSLAGGTGRPLGIAMGVLSLAVLRAGFNAIGAPPYVNEIAMGAILLIVAVLDGAYLARRLSWLRRAHYRRGECATIAERHMETAMLERASSTQSDTGDCIVRARELAPLIAVHAARAETERELAPEVLAALHDARLFRMLLPKSCDGLEVDPATFMRAVEELAKADGSTAWCVQACGCSMAAAYVEPAVAREIFGDARAVMAWGPVGPNAKAVASAGGYRRRAIGASPAASSMRPGSAATASCSRATARRGSAPTASRPSAPC